jgi:hypothetical protein
MFTENPIRTISENPLYPPAIPVRAHHLIMSNTQDALCGSENIEDIVARQMEGLDELRNGREYVLDILGPSDQTRSSFMSGLTEFYNRLRSLSDQDSILADGNLDAICRSACVGAHCMPPTSIQQDELIAIMEIRTQLLFYHEKQGIERDIDYSTNQSSILVKAGALRRIYAVSRNPVVEN